MNFLQFHQKSKLKLKNWILDFFHALQKHKYRFFSAIFQSRFSPTAELHVVNSVYTADDHATRSAAWI